jgi:hypothetical protein
MRNPSPIRNGDFAIDDDWATGGGQRAERIAKYLGPIDAIAAQQIQRAATRDDRDKSMPIVLNFMKPTVAVRRLPARSDNLKAHIGRQCRGGNVRFGIGN